MAIVMNGCGEDGSGPGVITIIQLEKPSGGGLGFNVVGGKDQPHIPGDTGIFVSRIRRDGAAYQDGRLKEGDRILAVNGESLEEAAHEDAVAVLRAVPPGPVSLQVEVDAQKSALEKPFVGFSPSSSHESVQTVIDTSKADGAATQEVPSLAGSVASLKSPAEATASVQLSPGDPLPLSSSSTPSLPIPEEGDVFAPADGADASAASSANLAWEAATFAVGLTAIGLAGFFAYRRFASK